MNKFLFIVMTGCLILCGCPPKPQQLAMKWVTTAATANNGMVKAAHGMQDRLRAQREKLMVEAAQTAASYADGIAKLDAIDKKYTPLFHAFIELEQIQNALAEGLEIARAAIKAGESPDIGNLTVLYIKLQQQFQKVMEGVL